MLGKSTSNHKDKRLVWGAAIGAITGAAIGDYMDKQEEEFRKELSGSGIDIIRGGDASYNQALSKKCAQIVKDYLVNQSIQGSRLKVTGYGESMPLMDNNTEKYRLLNRRVEIQIILYKG